ncbi:FG-GAP repeat domain-containing protein [Massilia antarctica]|uniref:FG-GAP repeat domain-containing protein n=1 Tax=Massilia antarctica TaxID=2765360 RepID=UPI00226ED9F7|nr:VCBS repeat-containing protein [Massilia sp. H27-R4]MCY0910316.1 VCBS repeat-containing protein [Massilia sp. H27-R4]
MKKSIGAGFIALVLTGCGGGGGTSAPATQPPPVVSTPAPTVTLALNQSKITLGSSATLTWSSTNATSCTASGAWTGAQAISGTAAQTPTASGAPTYTLTCTGTGGTINQSVALTVPIPVQKSSYESKASAGEVLGPQKLPAEVIGGNAVAFADFFQDGSYSMVTHSLEYNASDLSTASKFGHIRFYKNMSGTWVDKTSTILSNNVGCLHPRKAAVADFNNDGKPDIFIACHGFDAPPFSGELPIILMSQADGTYKSAAVPVTCFCHSASAADVNGDGFPDVLVTGDIAAGKPFFLINNKDGTFTQDFTRLPADTKSKPIFTAELIDFSRSGKYDVFLGGHEHEQYADWPATIFPNDGVGSFTTTPPKILPAAADYGLPLDIVVKNGNIYLLRTIDLHTNFYGGVAIQKIAYPSLASQIIYQHSGSYSGIAPGFDSKWVNWIVSYQGTVASLNAAYGVSVAQ